MSPSARRRAAFWLAAFGSIAMLLGHLRPLAPMSTSLWLVGLPSAAAMAALAARGARAGDAEFILRLKAGLLGGIWGTLGYDLVRIPFHYLGENPLSPIRAYGMWIAGAGRSSPLADLIGLLYHFSNGVTFAWIYAIPLLRRHWAWAVLWGLALETLAVLTAFGEVFAIRSNYSALWIAYGAHLFYGLPLGLACARPEAALRAALPLGRAPLGLATVIVAALFAAWFLNAFQPPTRQPRSAAGEIVIGPDAIYPGWTNLPAGGGFTLVNRTEASVRVKLRRPAGIHGEGETFELAPGDRRAIAAAKAGFYQVLLPDRPAWRSVIAAVHRDGDYRPER